MPAGFQLSTFAEGLEEPVAMEFASDGRLFVAERYGRVRIVENGLVAAAPFAEVQVFVENENGLVGLALDPDFKTNGYVYLYATVESNEAQIIRFTDPRQRDPAAASAGAELTVIRDHLPTRGVFHSGGGLKFGPDGKLYFGIGDNLVDENSQDMGTLSGKISRINPDGTTPEDNPFVTPTGTPRAVYALGFRNPFRFCFAPDGRLFVMDVGSDGDGRREEINLVYAGDNCGWPIVEGRQGLLRDSRFTDPIYDYHDGGAAPVGGVYYTGQDFPAEYQGNLFYLEYVLNRLYRTVLDGDRVVHHETFIQADGGPVDLAQGPDGCLYYSELHSGKIRRVSADRTAVAGATQPPREGDGAGELLPATRLCGFGSSFALAAVGAFLFVRARRRLLSPRPPARFLRPRVLRERHRDALR